MKRLGKCLFFTLCLLIPGGSLLGLQHPERSLFVPLLGLFWVIVCSYTRAVTAPLGFSAMLLGLLTLHAGSYLYGIYKYETQSVQKRTLVFFTLLVSINGFIAITSHLYKSKVYGFSFYHIPSNSMEPTLLPGDIILVNNWATPKTGDVVVLYRREKGIVLAKRVTQIRPNSNGTKELFVQGDNTLHSADSRRFGWLDGELMIGKAEFVWFSFANTERFLLNIK